MDTTTITFPEVKVEIPIKGLTFDNTENMIFKISQNIACRVFEKAITKSCYKKDIFKCAKI